MILEKAVTIEERQRALLANVNKSDTRPEVVDASATREQELRQVAASLILLFRDGPPAETTEYLGQEVKAVFGKNGVCTITDLSHYKVKLPQ